MIIFNVCFWSHIRRLCKDITPFTWWFQRFKHWFQWTYLSITFFWNVKVFCLVSQTKTLSSLILIAHINFDLNSRATSLFISIFSNYVLFQARKMSTSNCFFWRLPINMIKATDFIMSSEFWNETSSFLRGLLSKLQVRFIHELQVHFELPVHYVHVFSNYNHIIINDINSTLLI